MRSMRGLGIFLGGLAGAGCLAAVTAAVMTSGTAPTAPATAPAPRALAAYSGASGASGAATVSTATVSTATVSTAAGALPIGNPAGHQPVPAAARAVNTSHPNHVIGHGTPASCTSAAVVKAVAQGGIITFNCGPKPVTITMTATAKVVNTSHRVVLDGGGKVTLSGGGKIRILYMNTCDPKQKFLTNDCWEQQWPQLVVQNLTFRNAYSPTKQTAGVQTYGGGAIFDMGGQLKVVNSAFIGNRCYSTGPDLGGAAIRAYGMYMKTPVYITHDTFSGNSCSNGAALSGLYANFVVINSLLTNNKAIGRGANPARSGTPGGGSGGAIYTDGATYNLVIDGTAMYGNTANEGGGAIFFVVNNGPGVLKIEYSNLHNNHSGRFQDAPGIFDHVDYYGGDVSPVIIHSTVK